jgi:hypothetical protein
VETSREVSLVISFLLLAIERQLTKKSQVSKSAALAGQLSINVAARSPAAVLASASRIAAQRGRDAGSWKLRHGRAPEKAGRPLRRRADCKVTCRGIR